MTTFFFQSSAPHKKFLNSGHEEEEEEEKKHTHTDTQTDISLFSSSFFLNVTTADVAKNPRLVHARRRRDWFLRPELLREKVSRRAVREVY